MRGRYKITYTDDLGSWDVGKRRKSLSAAFCAARNLLKWSQVRDVNIIDFNTGKVWSVSPER